MDLTGIKDFSQNGDLADSLRQLAMANPAALNMLREGVLNQGQFDLITESEAQRQVEDFRKRGLTKADVYKERDRAVSAMEEELTNMEQEDPITQAIIQMSFKTLNDFFDKVIEMYNGPDAIVKVQLLHPDAKVPIYKHDNDKGCDVFCPEDTTIPARAMGYMVPTGLAVAIPEGWAIDVRPRSGLSRDTTMRIANAPGTIDEGYKDEIGILIDNFSNSDIFIEKGTRFAQFTLERNYKMGFEVVEDVKKVGGDRGGGFGSSGQK